MNYQKQRQAAPWSLILLFIILCLLIVAGGILYYINQRNILLTQRMKELTTIADLKIRQIADWRRERIADGYFLANNVSITSRFLKYLEDPADQKLKEELTSDLVTLVKSYDFKNALFLDAESRVQLFYPNQDTVIGDYLNTRLPEVIRQGKVVVTDLHQTGKVSFIHLDLLVPLISPHDKSIFGILILRIDPWKVLYPLLDSWPVVSRTSESLLIHTEGDEVVYLNELRHREKSQMVLRMPLSKSDLPAAMAVQGKNQTLDGVDYRGVKVIAAMNKVPETRWYLVAKIDRKEALESLARQTRLIILAVLLLVLVSGFILGTILWYQRIRYYRSRYEAEVERMALVKHYDYILKNANDIIFLFDSNFFIVEVNDRAIETYLFSREELIGTNVRELRTEERISELESDLRRLDEMGYATFETVHRRKNGTTFPVEISARKLEIEGTTFYQSIGRDITERKIADEKIRESEERFRKLFEESPLGMVMTGKDMGAIKANPAFCKMLGYREEELLGMTFRNFTHHDSIAPDEVGIFLLVAKKIPVYRTEKKYVRSDGTLMWGSTTIVLIRNKKDEVQLFFAMVEDITARKTAEAELEKSFSLQKATLESTADGILVVDNDGKIVQYNHKFALMWGIPDEVMDRLDDQVALDFVRMQLKDPEGFLGKVKILYADPEAVISDQVEFIDGRVFDRYSQPQKINGKTVGRVWSFRDVTARVKAEADIIAAKEKAEESDRLKTAFLHNVSHEIRTPMNAILGFSALLNESRITEQERKQFTDVISQSGTQLLSIINDIVDLASIESRQMRVTLTKINLNTTLRKLCEQFSYKEKPGTLALVLETNGSLDDSEIITDNTKLIQIISNLINNAFKFTEKGKIIFGYSLKGENLEFFVRDTGIGIAPEYQARVFERFFQVDSAVSRQYGGTGLGLSICKAYVELLGGRISLESATGSGTCFFFTLPYVKGNSSLSA